MLYYLGVSKLNAFRRSKRTEADWVIKWNSSEKPANRYILTRSGTDPPEGYSLLMVNNMAGHDALIEAFSFVRVSFFKEDRDGDILRGYMFWYPCDIYGNRLRGTNPIVIKEVPDGPDLTERQFKNKIVEYETLTGRFGQIISRSEGLEIPCPPLMKKEWFTSVKGGYNYGYDFQNHCQRQQCADEQEERV